MVLSLTPTSNTNYHGTELLINKNSILFLGHYGSNRLSMGSLIWINKGDVIIGTGQNVSNAITTIQKIN